jgi:hypothetical protein
MKHVSDILIYSDSGVSLRFSRIKSVSLAILQQRKESREPVPPQSSNVNNDDSINLLDVTYLIDYLYKSGPEPKC